MNLFQQIYESIAKFETDYGRKPTRIYLGHVEFNYLEQQLKNFTLFAHAHGHRPQVCGLDAYKVHEQTHLHTTCEQPVKPQ